MPAEAVQDTTARPNPRRRSLVAVAVLGCLVGYVLAIPLAGWLLAAAMFVDMLIVVVGNSFVDGDLDAGAAPIQSALVAMAWWLVPVAVATSAAIVAAGTRRLRSHVAAAGIGFLSAVAGVGLAAGIGYLALGG